MAATPQISFTPARFKTLAHSSIVDTKLPIFEFEDIIVPTKTIISSLR